MVQYLSLLRATEVEQLDEMIILVDFLQVSLFSFLFDIVFPSEIASKVIPRYVSYFQKVLPGHGMLF